MRLFLPKCFLLVLAISFSLLAEAQLPGSINIDQLSDQQIAQLVQQYGLSGLSETELVAKAKEKGLSDADIAKLRARMQGLSGSPEVQKSGSPEESPIESP